MRSLESRIFKLETRTARPDEMLVVWRRPDGSVAEALKDVTFAKGDKVICAEWFDDDPLPSPRWHSARRHQLSSSMGRRKYDHLERTIDRIAERSGQRDESFAPFPRFTQGRAKEMSDEGLIYALLGVRT
jgi:hypothetical protein